MSSFQRLLNTTGRSLVLKPWTSVLTAWVSAGFPYQFYSTAGQYQHIKVEKRGAKKNVVLIQFDRAETMNALCDALMFEVKSALGDAEADKDVGAVVFTGNEKVFTAGGDIREIANIDSFYDAYKKRLTTNFDIVAECRKPVLAAVNGFALGIGCELALMCDIIYAGAKAQFGMPQIAIGILPGAGGSQRLPRAIGKSKALEMILTGNRISAQEAEKAGLVSKVFPPDQLVEETIKTAEKIAGFSKLIAALCKESVNKGYDMSLADGLHFEKKLVYGAFSTHDRKEGMTAFIEKRPPIFKDC